MIYLIRIYRRILKLGHIQLHVLLIVIFDSEQGERSGSSAVEKKIQGIFCYSDLSEAKPGSRALHIIHRFCKSQSESSIFNRTAENGINSSYNCFPVFNPSFQRIWIPSSTRFMLRAFLAPKCTNSLQAVSKVHNRDGGNPTQQQCIFVSSRQ